MLLNAYGWSEIGLFAGYAAIGLLIASIAVFGAFLFEIFSLTSSRKQESTTRVSPVPAPKARVLA
jgi:hypothetical protein